MRDTREEGLHNIDFSTAIECKKRGQRVAFFTSGSRSLTRTHVCAVPFDLALCNEPERMCCSIATHRYTRVCALTARSHQPELGRQRLSVHPPLSRHYYECPAHRTWTIVQATNQYAPNIHFRRRDVFGEDFCFFERFQIHINRNLHTPKTSKTTPRICYYFFFAVRFLLVMRSMLDCACRRCTMHAATVAMQHGW